MTAQNKKRFFYLIGQNKGDNYLISEFRRIRYKMFFLPFLFLLWSYPKQAYSQEWVFEKIVDNNTPLPDGGENFSYFSQPALDQGNVAFSHGENIVLRNSSIYTYINGNLLIVTFCVAACV